VCLAVSLSSQQLGLLNIFSYFVNGKRFFFGCIYKLLEIPTCSKTCSHSTPDSKFKSVCLLFHCTIHAMYVF